MEVIKEDYWNSYLLKHREFIELVDSLDIKAELLFVAPVCELVVLVSEVIIQVFQEFDEIKKQAGTLLRSYRDLAGYKMRLAYKQKKFEEFKGFDWIRKQIFESNSEIIKNFEPSGNSELEVKSGQRFLLRTGDFHQNWCKGVSIDGKKGFVPKSCIQNFANAQILQEPDRIYKIQPMSQEDFFKFVSEHLTKISNFIKSFRQISENYKDQRHLISLISNLLELTSANTIFIQNPDQLPSFLHYLPLYIESNKLCIKILQKSPDKLQLSPLIVTILTEIKSFVFLLRTYSYTLFSIEQNTLTTDTVEALSLSCWSLSKPFQIIPTDKDLASYLEDPRQKSLKRFTMHKTSLILLPDFLIYASIPVKIKKIIPISSILDISTLNEYLITKTSKKNYKFQMDSAKRALDWSEEIKGTIVKTSLNCSVCKEINIIKVVSACVKCGKLICWICECEH